MRQPVNPSPHPRSKGALPWLLSLAAHAALVGLAVLVVRHAPLGAPAGPAAGRLWVSLAPAAPVPPAPAPTTTPTRAKVRPAAKRTLKAPASKAPRAPRAPRRPAQRPEAAAPAAQPELTRRPLPAAEPAGPAPEPPAQETTQSAAPDEAAEIAKEPAETGGTPAAPSPTAQPAPALQPMGGVSAPARLVTQGTRPGEMPRPPYPRWARQKEIEGRVVLELEVLTSGGVGAVTVIESSGSKALDEYTIEWARATLHFEPARLYGVAIKTHYRLAYRYGLVEG